MCLNPWRYAAEDGATLKQLVARIVTEDPDLSALLVRLRDSGLPDAWLSSGAIYGTVWNVLTGRPRRHGIKDYDIIYFDGSDLSWEGEDREIRRVSALMASLGLPVEIRNQARVHLWYRHRFGADYPMLRHATESLDYYASRTHAVAVRAGPQGIEIRAPFGLEPVFAMRMEPNTVLPNAASHREKAARAQVNWPELTVVAWP